MLHGFLVLALAASTVDQARAAFSAGQFERSAGLFEQSAQATGKGEAWFNAGLAWFRASKPERAIRAYTLALEAGGVRARLMPELSSRMTELRKKTVELRLRRDPGCEVHLDERVAAEREWVMPGLHQLVATCGETVGAPQAVTLIAGEFREFVFTAPPAPAPLPAPPPDTAEVRATAPAVLILPAPPPPPAAQPRASSGGWLITSAVVAGLSAATGLASGFLWGTVERTWQRFLVTDRTSVAVSQQGLSEQTTFHVALGAAIGLGVLAGVFLLVGLVE